MPDLCRFIPDMRNIAEAGRANPGGRRDKAFLFSKVGLNLILVKHATVILEHSGAVLATHTFHRE
jgi:hypothetical protein